jgi:hypothetical protein
LDVGSTNDNHNIGRAIINGTIHDANKRDALSIGRWDGSDQYINFTGLKYHVTTGADGGYTGFDNQAHMTFWTWGNSVANSREVMRLTSRGRLGIGTTNPQELLHVVGKTIIDNGVGLAPTNGVYGSGGTRIILWPGSADNTPYSFGIAGGTLWYSVPTGANHAFYVGTTERMRINHNGNINVGTTSEYSTATKMHIKGASYGYSQPLVRIEQTAGWDGNYCLQTVGYSDLGGIRINGGDSGNSIFKTAATGDMGLTVNNGNILFNVNGAERMRINNSGRIGVANTNPQSMLHLGNCEVINSAPVIVFGKNVNNVGFRNAFMGYTDNFFFVIGDYGNTNAGANALTSQLAIIYNAPASSLVIETSGYVRMAYGFGNGSDERIKSNIKSIENALDKTLLLRGVEFNLNIEPERKRIGLIAQEVELIIPEVVRTSEDDGLKSIEYQNIVGLLVEAIKQLNNKVTNLENILKNNNLY